MARELSGYDDTFANQLEATFGHTRDDPEPEPHTHLVLGGGYYGQGDTLDKAKRNFRAVGGRLTDGYRHMDFGPAIDWVSIGPWGDVTWETRDGSPYDPDNPDHQPVVTDHARRNR